MAVFPGKGLLGGRPVQTSRLEDETDLVQRRGHRKLPDAVQRQRHLSGLLFQGFTAPFVEQRLAITPDIDKRRMPAGDNGRSLVSGRLDLRLDIKFFIDPLFQGNLDTMFVDHPPSVLHGLGRHVAQHLELVLRAADRRTECHGNRQSDHPRTGNSHPHGIFEDICTQLHGNLFGFLPQGFGGTGNAQCHGNRFGTPDRRDDLSLDQFDDLFAFRFR